MMLINHVTTNAVCPRCGVESEIQFETSLDGNGPVRDYRLENVVDWCPHLSAEYSGRPSLGDLIAEAYAECPACGKDFFAFVIVERDVIKEVRVDHSRGGYIP